MGGWGGTRHCLSSRGRRCAAAAHHQHVIFGDCTPAPTAGSSQRQQASGSSPLEITCALILRFGPRGYELVALGQQEGVHRKGQLVGIRPERRSAVELYKVTRTCRGTGVEQGRCRKKACRRRRQRRRRRRRCQQRRRPGRHRADLKAGRDARTTASVAASIAGRTRRAEVRVCRAVLQAGSGRSKLLWRGRDQDQTEQQHRPSTPLVCSPHACCRRPQQGGSSPSRGPCVAQSPPICRPLHGRCRPAPRLHPKEVDSSGASTMAGEGAVPGVGHAARGRSGRAAGRGRPLAALPSMEPRQLRIAGPPWRAPGGRSALHTAPGGF